MTGATGGGGGMLIRIYLKDPDGVYESIDDAVRGHVQTVDGVRPNDDAYEDLVTARRKSADKELARWVEYGEYVTVEIDTVAKTARVVPVGRP